jgi:hypothetical protein
MKGFRISKIDLILIIILVGSAAIPVYTALSNAVQASSFTCARCHPGPYATWKASSEHPVSVSCQQCHAGHPKARSTPPGFLADEAQVDPHCLSCHQEMAEKMEVERRLIKISHRRHTDEGLGCSDCHKNVAHGIPSAEGNRPPKSACYKCHILEIDGSAEDPSCQMCHYIILTTS